MRMGFKIRGSETGQEDKRVSHNIFADNCYLFAETNSQMLEMVGDAVGNLTKRGLGLEGGSDGIDSLGP